MKRQLVAVILIIAGSLAGANVKLPAIFGDNMVLQQRSNAAIWGWADKGETVEVLGSWAKSPVTAKAGKDGKWQVKVKTPEASGPYTLTVKGKNTITLQNVLIGEVWVCSGQSNMEWPLQSADNAKEEIKAADFPKIRLFTVTKKFSLQPQSDCKGQWKICSPDTAGPFSAVGYFFGRQIHQKLNVPVGLINTSWGGTPAQAWTSEKTVKSFPAYKTMLEEIEQEKRIPDEVRAKKEQLQNEKAMADWEAKVAAIDPGTQQNWQDPKTDISDWKEMEQPREWTGTELEKIDGIVWFQRTTNLPPSWARTDMELHLGPIDDIDTVWVNGVKIASTTDRVVDRRYIIPSSALHTGPNVIAVRIVDTGSQGGFRGNEEQMRIGPAGADVKTCATLAKTWKYKASLTDKPLPAAPKKDSGRFNQNSPTGLFNGMISPLVGFGIAGAIWYQGESNRERPAEYAALFPAMITDWRTHWNIGDFPFYWVQIAPFSYENRPVFNSAYLREAQMKTLKSVKNGGMAVTMDIGTEKNIHPKNKLDVGKRLALWALAKTYGQKDLAYSGPMYKSMRVEGQKIRLYFDNVHGGLLARDGHLSDFIIAGEDRKFVPAQAVVDGNTIVVSSDQVQKPVAVRYAWSNWTKGTLFNKEELPASSFRTDNWNDHPDKKI
jgi:sialate O-acetylesterase